MCKRCVVFVNTAENGGGEGGERGREREREGGGESEREGGGWEEGAKLLMVYVHIRTLCFRGNYTVIRLWCIFSSPVVALSERFFTENERQDTRD